MKLCSKCRQWKSETEFHKEKKSRDGLRYYCKACAIQNAQKHHLENRDSRCKKMRKYHLENKEKFNAISRAYAASHKEEAAARNKSWAAANPEANKKRYVRDKIRIRERQKSYYLRDRVNKLSYAKNYRTKNAKSVAKSKLKCYLRKRRTDPGFRVLCNLRRRLHHALKGKTKSARTVDLLGCTVEFLIERITGMLQPGMSWHNYGKWELDHIKPCANFDFTNPDHQRECFHYTNLQPLWKLHNIVKSDGPNSSGFAAPSAARSSPSPTNR